MEPLSQRNAGRPPRLQGALSVERRRGLSAARYSSSSTGLPPAAGVSAVRVHPRNLPHNSEIAARAQPPPPFGGSRDVPEQDRSYRDLSIRY